MMSSMLADSASGKLEYTSSNAQSMAAMGGIGNHFHHHQSAFEEEEKADNAGSMRAPKSKAMMLGEDHGSSGNN